jgi:hypothetical protein
MKFVESVVVGGLMLYTEASGPVGSSPLFPQEEKAPPSTMSKKKRFILFLFILYPFKI